MDNGETGCKGVDLTHLTEYGPVAGSYEHSNEPSGSIKGEEFLGQWSDS
jgi:hypothetical protein